MKQTEIKTSKCTLLVVEFPESVENIHTETDLICFDHKEFSYDFPDYIIVKGNFQHIGTLDQMTEEVWKGIVDFDYFDRGRERFEFYVDYQVLLTKTYSETFTATESGLSLLKANGILLNNKYQDDWDELCQWGHGDFSKDGKSSYELYTEEQAKVWKNPHIFIKQK